MFNWKLHYLNGVYVAQEGPWEARVERIHTHWVVSGTNMEDINRSSVVFKVPMELGRPYLVPKLSSMLSFAEALYTMQNGHHHPRNSKSEYGQMAKQLEQQEKDRLNNTPVQKISVTGTWDSDQEGWT